MRVLKETIMNSPLNNAVFFGRTRPLSSAPRQRSYRLLAFLVCFLTGAGLGQTAPVLPPHSAQPPAAGKMTSRPPLSHLYMHFLLYQNHLDRAAATREAKGEDGSQLRDHLQKRLGFNAAEFGV